MSLAELQDPANFGVPVGQSLTDLSAGSILSASGQTYTNRRIVGTANTSTDLTGSGNTFINCRWQDMGVALLPGANGNVFTRCEAQKMTIVSGTTGTRLNRWKSTGKVGEDGFTITNDRAGHATPSDIVIDGFHVAGDAESLVVGSGNHYDCIQVRGVDGLTIRNFCFDHGTTFSALFNAAIFLEGAQGGNHNVLIENGFSRAAGYFHLYLSASGLTVRDVTFARVPDAGLVYSGGSYTIDDQSGNAWDDGTPITDLLGG